MRDAADEVLYVGKAKNLRKRLGNYRVANPERMPRRHLRLLRAVERIELERCSDERSALARESELLRLLRPRFNRAGTWPGTPRFFAWRATEEGLDLAVTQAVDSSWDSCGPLGYSAFALRIILVRLLWCALHAERSLGGMPQGWFDGRYGEAIKIPVCGKPLADFQEAGDHLNRLFAGRADELKEWVYKRTEKQIHPFEVSVRASDLETLAEFVSDFRRRDHRVEQRRERD